MASQTRKKIKSDNPMTGDAQSDQLREIQNLLFGEQLGNVEDEIDSFRKEIDGRLSDLEMTIQSSIDLQAEHVNKELANISEAIAQLHSAQQTDKTSVDGTFDQVNELIKTNNRENTKTTKALQRQLEKESEKIKNSIAQQKKDLQTQLKDAVAKLTQNKTDRKEMAELLQSVVKKLETE